MQLRILKHQKTVFFNLYSNIFGIRIWSITFSTQLVPFSHARRLNLLNRLIEFNCSTFRHFLAPMLPPRAVSSMISEFTRVVFHFYDLSYSKTQISAGLSRCSYSRIVYRMAQKKYEKHLYCTWWVLRFIPWNLAHICDNTMR